MSMLKLVLSDLHLADGHAILDCFGEQQQSALEGLLNATQRGRRKRADQSAVGAINRPLQDAERDVEWGAEQDAEQDVDDVELIINGDCFDFLAIPPYEIDGTIDAGIALGKLKKIIAAHRAFFEALRRFIASPGRHVTFIIGNHDVELGFEEVRRSICEAIGTEKGVDFCLTRFYRPLPDVYIEHGNQYDFWNYASGLWDKQGNPLTLQPRTIALPIGTQYFQRASHLISIQYPYFDHFEPSMNSMRQIALLCLLNPEIVIETARHTMALFSYARKPLTGGAAAARARQAAKEARASTAPTKLFELAMIDFAALQQDIMTRKRADFIDNCEPAGAEDAQAEQMREFLALREALALPLVEAVRAICIPTIYQMGESTARGMQDVLNNDPALRYAIAGHTHMARVDAISTPSHAAKDAAASSCAQAACKENDGSQVYLNTASWTRRFAIPAAGEMTPALIAWLRQPDWNAIPLRDVTQLVFAMISAEEGKPSSADLYVWEGDVNGSYRVLA